MTHPVRLPARRIGAPRWAQWDHESCLWRGRHGHVRGFGRTAGMGLGDSTRTPCDCVAVQRAASSVEASQRLQHQQRTGVLGGPRPRLHGVQCMAGIGLSCSKLQRFRTRVQTPWSMCSRSRSDSWERFAVTPDWDLGCSIRWRPLAEVLARSRSLER